MSQAANNRSYYQKRHSDEEPVNCAGNSKRRRFTSPYSAPGGNNVQVSENERQKEIALDEKLANVEELDKTNTKELKLDMKILEDSNKRLKNRVRHLITDNTLLTNIYDAMNEKQEVLKVEMAKIELENANFRRINEDLNKNKRDFEATYLDVTNYNLELTNKLRMMEEETRKLKKDLDDLMRDYTTLQCETKRIKEEPGHIESLNNEKVQLTEKYAAHEAELLQLREEVKKCGAEKGEMKAQNKELSEGFEKTVMKLNQINKDLKVQRDNVDGEKFQLKGEIRQIKHEMEVEKRQGRERTAIFEKEKETLLIRCKEKDEKNEKLENENRKFKDLIRQFQGLQKKVQEMVGGDGVEVLGEKSGEDLNSTENRVEIHLNSGVFCCASDWKKLETCHDPKDFCNKVLQLIFTKEELLECSVKGTGIRPALNEAKTDALRSCVLNRFPAHAPEFYFIGVVNNILDTIRGKPRPKKKRKNGTKCGDKAEWTQIMRSKKLLDPH